MAIRLLSRGANPRPQSLLRTAGVALVRGFQLFGRDEAIAVGVDLVEVRGETRGVGLRFRLADPAVAVGVEFLEVLSRCGGTALLVEGAQLVGRDLTIVVRVDLVEVLRDHRQRRGFGLADLAVAIGVRGFETLGDAALVFARRGEDEERRGSQAGGGEGNEEILAGYFGEGGIETS